ncbi:MAG: Prolipoprotein diacylglyceryl transferase [uncultured Solirubrobacterales bacterium]|uniref:Phosphatidylglycerol--prolipoprotein diacylglyceryl transferase n=1 Tax=uncultured Solirubrobacterales bacterium TaxID=768556 RepID=A0A6J4RXL5_9ACTN|nr:MAG: Prolipoprotein diacylglyceryl transferase [uncultured Solirubrobacterales bacterium]
MIPEIDIGPVELQTFGIALALSLVSCGLLAARRLRELGKPGDWAYEMVLAAGIGGVVGAKLDWIIQNPGQAFDGSLIDIVIGPGLVFFGGLLGGALAVAAWAYRRGFLGWSLLDLGGVGVALGYALGRIGCQLSGDGDYGVPSDLPWAMAYPNGTLPTTDLVHPTPIYETLAMGLVTVVLWNLRDRFAPGVLFGLYLVIAGLERFLIEFIRRNDAVLAGLTIAQLISVAMVVAGSALIAWRVRKARLATA